jgi:hypothetical protein
MGNPGHVDWFGVIDDNVDDPVIADPNSAIRGRRPLSFLPPSPDFRGAALHARLFFTGNQH